MESVKRLTNLLRSYRNQQCVLFVGAGFSKGALRKTPTGELLQIPSGRDLIEILKEKLSEESDDLGALSELYEDQYGEHGLYTLLCSLYMAFSTTETQEKISSYKWKEIYTTNYDNVLQLCLAKNGKPFNTFTPLKRPIDVDYRTLPIIHINGFVPGSSFTDFKNEIKLTNSQYSSDDFSKSAWGARFRNDISTSPCIVFAGYSLYDLDIARILNTFEGMRERIFFIVENKPSRALEKKLLQFGEIIPIGIEGLAPIISSILADADQSYSTYFSAWEKVSLSNSIPASLRDIDVTNFWQLYTLNPIHKMWWVNSGLIAA